MKKPSNTTKRLCIICCLLMLLSAGAAGQAESAGSDESTIDSLDVADLNSDIAIYGVFAAAAHSSSQSKV